MCHHEADMGLVQLCYDGSDKGKPSLLSVSTTLSLSLSVSLYHSHSLSLSLSLFLFLSLSLSHSLLFSSSLALPLIGSRYPSLSLIVSHYPSLSLIVSRYPSLSLIVSHYPSLSPIVSRYPSLSIQFNSTKLYWDERYRNIIAKATYVQFSLAFSLSLSLALSVLSHSPCQLSPLSLSLSLLGSLSPLSVYSLSPPFLPFSLAETLSTLFGGLMLADVSNAAPDSPSVWIPLFGRWLTAVGHSPSRCGTPAVLAPGGSGPPAGRWPLSSMRPRLLSGLVEPVYPGAASL